MIIYSLLFSFYSLMIEEKRIKVNRESRDHMEKEEKVLARKHWISFGAKPKGIVVVDDGAKKALLSGGKSLLLPGIISWSGHFKKGDVIVVQDKMHHEIARGITDYSTSILESTTEKKGQREVIHCDNLVLCER